MSLLEDVFLEDEAGEAQELERVIEGDEFDERPAPHSGEDSNDDSEKDDEAEEDKRRVDPTNVKTKRITKNPRVILNPARLTGPRGIQVIPDHFKDFKFKGKGHEKEDLDLVLKKLEHWAYRLFPKFQFEDCLKKIETLGKKRPVMVHLHKIRSDQYISDDVVVQNDSSGDEAPRPLPEEDEFDKLLQQQIELARATPAPNSAKKGVFTTPRADPHSFMMPKATSSPSISEEQKERMLRNRRLAEERRLARLKNAEQNNISVISEVPVEVEDHQTGPVIKNNENVTIINDVPIDLEKPRDEFNEPRKKQNRSNVIDSSDDDCDELVVNESITVDIHDTRPNIGKNNSVDPSNETVEAQKQNRSNLIDSSDEDTANQPIDYENHEEENDVPKKKLKFNVIDSSEEDSEEDAEKILKDIQSINSSNKSQSDEVMVNDEERKSEVTKDNITTNNNLNEFEKSSEEDLPNEHESDLDTVENDNSNIGENINNDNEKCDLNNIATNELEKTNNSEILPSKNKENIDNNTDLELMDVDFNEDF